MSALTRWIGHRRGTGELVFAQGDLLPGVAFLLGLIFYGLLCLAIVRGLMGLERTPAWKAVLAAALGIVGTSLLFGSVLPEGSWGWHPYLQIEGLGSLAFGFRG